MLSNFCDDDRITFCLFVNLFDHIRTGQTFRMIGKRVFCFIFLDLFDPFGVFLLWQFFINCRKHFFDISNHTFIDNDIFVHLCHINIKLENFCITCKFIWITCDTVGESCTDYDQKIAFTDSKVRYTADPFPGMHLFPSGNHIPDTVPCLRTHEVLHLHQII